MSPGTNKRGVLIVALSGIIAVLAFLLLGVVSLSLTRTDTQKLQHLANIAAIGAISAYVDTPDTMAHSDRAQVALQRAIQVLQNNSKLFGQDSTLGQHIGFEPSENPGSSGSGGVIQFGRVHYEPLPGGAPAPCAGQSGRYPCLEIYPPPSTALPNGASINAIALTVKTAPTDAYRALFGPFLGFAPLTLSTTATSNVIPRCIAYAIDGSGSGLAETHIAKGVPDFNLSTGSIMDDDPDSWPAPGLFAYRQEVVASCDCTRTPLELYNEIPRKTECAYWCNMVAVRPPSATPVPRHFRSDYLGAATTAPAVPIGVASKENGGPRYYETSFGADGEAMLVDRYFAGYNSYWGPQPLSTWYLAMHAGLRSIERVKSAADRAAFIAFAGDVVGMVPPPINPGFTFPVGIGADPIPPLSEPHKWNTSKYDLLVQMTNIMGRGMHDRLGAPVPGYPRVEPNAIQRGWFPAFTRVWVPSSTPQGQELATDSGGRPLTFWSRTNPIRAVQFAIQALRSCPDSAHKAIILASDGVPSCKVTEGSFTDISTSTCFVGEGENAYNNIYLDAESYLLSAIRQELVESNISLTMLLSGEKVDPHVLVKTATGNPDRLIAPHEARQNGLCTGSGLCPDFFDLTPDCGYSTPCPGPDPNRTAYLNLNQPGYKFRRVNALWGQLAMDTNGIVCPVMEMGPPECYEDPPPDTALPGVRVLKFSDSCSGPLGARMQYSYYELTQAEQSSACVLGAQGPSPFGLFEPDPDHSITPIGIP